MPALSDALSPIQAAPGQTVTVRLTAIRYGARDINLYELSAVDGRPLPAADPGAHIGLVLPQGVLRQYSLIESSAAPTRYLVGVKRDAAGRGGSVLVHDALKVGGLLQIEPPRNNFPLNEAAEYSVLIAGGIGVTPLYCMLRRLQALGRPVRLHYSCRSRQDAVFLEALADDPDVSLHFDDEQGRLLPMAEIVAAAPPDADLYCCGPGPMLAAFEALAAGRPPERVHVEYFTAAHAAAQEGGFVVELARSGREATIPPGKSILHVLLDMGLDLPHSCEEGVCGACETKVIGGVPDHRDSILSAGERAANRSMMICCSGAKSDRLVLDI